MAKTGTKEKKRKVSKNKVGKGLFNGTLIRLLMVSAVVGCGVILYTTEKDCSDKEAEMDRIQTKIDAYKMDNEDLRRTLESDDLSAYMERVALEERGYAYPDERRFYDTSRD